MLARSARGAATLAVVAALALVGGAAALLAGVPLEDLRRAVTLGDADVDTGGFSPSGRSLRMAPPGPVSTHGMPR